MAKNDVFHTIRLGILEQLKASPPGLRYSEMKPRHLENDLYNYHLQYLVKHSLVVKHDDAYDLTSKGKEFLIELNPISKSGETNQFKVAAMCIIQRKAANTTELLYQYRTRAPFRNELEMVAGGLMRGEFALAAAKRRAKQEAGVSTDFRLLGLLRKIRYNQSGELYSDIIYHVCLSDDYTGTIADSNEFGKKTWLPLSAAAQAESDSLTGSKELAKVLLSAQKNGFIKLPFFYIEEVYDHDIY